MGYFLLPPIVYLAAVLDTSLAPPMQVGRAAPDFLALAAVLWVSTLRGRRTFLAAGIFGLAADLLAPGRPGVGLACFLLMGYVVGRWGSGQAAGHLVWRVATVLVATTILALTLGLARLILGEVSLPFFVLIGRALGVGVYTAVVSLPVLMVLGWIREARRARS